LINDRQMQAAGAIRFLPLRTPTLPPATHTNCCFIGGEGRIYAVDPAPGDDAERALLWRHVQELEAGGERLIGVILTHLHFDHIGAAAWLAQRAQVPVLASARTKADLEAGCGGGLSAGGLVIEAVPEVSAVIGAKDQLVGGWQVLATPGHAHGHLCFWQRASRSLVAGDMIASQSTILIEPEQGDMAAYLASLETLARLQPEWIVAAHGAAIADGETALRQLIAHRLQRERKTIAALRVLKAATVEQLLPIAYDDTAEAIWPLAAFSLTSHLLKLAADGRAHCASDGRWSVDASAADP
jgi:glyoxylase-like metal-dependent hydrolase (beta-lactamase superfamily II)